MVCHVSIRLEIQCLFLYDNHSLLRETDRRTFIINKKQFIVVEGPVGVGKTTLARKMAASLGTGLILEQPADNPFLERFYRYPDRFALQTQLFFLFQRVNQLKELRQRDLFMPVQIADFMLAKDQLFASVTLEEEELNLYQQVYQQLAPVAPVPDLVVYLQASTEVLMRRIRRRGTLFERNMQKHYVQELSNAYTRYFLHYHQSVLLTINTEKVNFMDNEEHFQLLLEQINTIHSGRHYFNPVI